MQTRDSLINRELAKQSTQMAEATQKDSSAMKAIAIVTMVFLPGTAISVSYTKSPKSTPFRRNELTDRSDNVQHVGVFQCDG